MLCIVCEAFIYSLTCAICATQAFDALLTSLDMRGVRESHLHIMLQKIEVPFRDRIQRNSSATRIAGMKTGDDHADVSSSPGCNAGVDDSPCSTVCAVNSDSLEPSSSFEIELGRNEVERGNTLKRYQDLQTWMWKECFSSAVLRAMTCEKKRCAPLLGVCYLCLDSYMNTEGHCHSCHTTSKADNRERFLEQTVQFEDRVKVEQMNFMISNSSLPFRIRLVKVLLNSLEVRMSVL